MWVSECVAQVRFKLKPFKLSGFLSCSTHVCRQHVRACVSVCFVACFWVPCIGCDTADVSSEQQVHNDKFMYGSGHCVIAGHLVVLRCQTCCSALLLVLLWPCRTRRLALMMALCSCSSRVQQDPVVELTELMLWRKGGWKIACAADVCCSAAQTCATPGAAVQQVASWRQQSSALTQQRKQEHACSRWLPGGSKAVCRTQQRRQQHACTRALSWGSSNFLPFCSRAATA
jgi:hypothetical protein